MHIDINTRMITLIGTPLRQSFAARMQNAGYAAAGLNMCYFYTETDARHLGEIVNGIRYMPSFAGFAVTKPNKVRVLEYLDELDPLCGKTGACNTVLRTPDNRLVGYNTDGIGFYRSFEAETDFELRDAVCFCMGAGGAGRAICAALAYKGAKRIYIADIAAQGALALARDVRENFGCDAQAVPYGDFSELGECALIVNATGVGMGESAGRSPVPKELLHGGQFCFDACYNPERTRFLLDAQEKGCRVMNGLSMSLYQGIAQIEIWTGRPAPIVAMRAALEQLLRENAGIAQGGQT